MTIILLRGIINNEYVEYHDYDDGAGWSMKKVKYCKRNMKLGSKSVYEAMKEKYPEIKRKKSDCLGNCRTCKMECFVVVKSKTVSAPTPEQLYKRLKKMIG